MTNSEVMEILEMYRPKVINGLHEDDHELIMENREKLAAQGIEVL
tara:strand:- start:88 stop:222 length:135 start_codon:yes stop_codon:yes gene_type:complete